MALQWNGERVEFVASPRFGEMAEVERQTKTAWHALTSSERLAACVMVSLRRHGVVLGWADALALDNDVFVDDEPDPTQAAPEPEAAAATTQRSASGRARASKQSSTPTS